MCLCLEHTTPLMKKPPQFDDSAEDLLRKPKRKELLQSSSEGETEENERKSKCKKRNGINEKHHQKLDSKPQSVPVVIQTSTRSTED